MDKIITIDREFGSGGREIGLLLSEKLNIPFYDKKIITMTAEKGGLAEDFIEKNEEGNHLLKEGKGRIPFASLRYQPDLADGIFLHQCNVIKEIAKKGPCIIVGRCAGYVLGKDAMNVFIAASMPFKIERKRKIAPEKKDYSDQEMEKYINDVNLSRQNYYEHNTGRSWGNIQNYDLCIFSDLIGVDGCVDTILTYLNNIKE